MRFLSTRTILTLTLAAVLMLAGCIGRPPADKLVQLVLAVDTCVVAPGGSVNLEVKGLSGRRTPLAVPDPQWELSDPAKGTLDVDGTKAVFTAANDAKGNVHVIVKSGNLSANYQLFLTEPSVSPVVCHDSGGLPLAEFFDVDTIEEFFSADYKSLHTDPAQPLYVVKAGDLGKNIYFDEDGNLVLWAGRFTIGMPADRPDTSENDSPGGTLDLSRPWRLTLHIVSAEEAGEATSGSQKQLIVYVDNNTTSASKSSHKGASRVYNVPVSKISAGPLVITSSVGTSRSFIQIRTESGARVVISGFKLEYN